MVYLILVFSSVEIFGLEEREREKKTLEHEKPKPNLKSVLFSISLRYQNQKFGTKEKKDET